MQGGDTPTSVGRVRWRHNEDVTHCVSCEKKFNAFLRRHHCRGCGDVFCAKCTPYSMFLPHRGYPDEKVRACRACASPQIVNVSSIPTVGGEMLISAHNIGDSVDGLVVEVESVECTGLRLLTPGPPAKIRCSVQSGVGKDKRLKVMVATGLWTEIGFNYNPPTVQHCTRPPTSGGDIVVTGLNFGRASRDVEILIGKDLGLILDDGTLPDSDQIASRRTLGSDAANFNETIEQKQNTNQGARRRSATLLEKVSLLRPHCALRCHVPPGVGKDIPIVVNVAGQYAEGRFSYAPPRIFSLSDISAAGGQLKITGTNLGSTSDVGKISVTVELQPIESTASKDEKTSSHVMHGFDVQVMRSHTELVCEVMSPYGDLWAQKGRLFADSEQRVPQAKHANMRRSSTNIFKGEQVSQEFQAKVVVTVAEQPSNPEIVRILAPPTPKANTPPPTPVSMRRNSISSARGTPSREAIPTASNNSTPQKEGSRDDDLFNDAKSSLPILNASVNSMSFRRRSLHSGRAGDVQAQAEIAGLLAANGVNAVNRGTVLAPSVSASSAIIGAQVTEEPLSWTPDSASDHCLLCSIEFTMFRRRHHCRLCGALVCGSCSGNSLPTTSSATSNGSSAGPENIGDVGVMVRACDQCFTLRKLRGERASIISKSRLLMSLLPPDEGAEFHQSLVVALAEGSRQCAERICVQESHRNPNSFGNINESLTPTPRLANAPRGPGKNSDGKVERRLDNWPGPVLATAYTNHRGRITPPTPSVIAPYADPDAVLNVM